MKFFKKKAATEYSAVLEQALMLEMRIDHFFRLMSRRCDKTESRDQRLRRKDVVQRLVDNILTNLIKRSFSERTYNRFEVALTSENLL